MAAHPPKSRLILSLLACCCSVAAAFLLQDGNHDETLPGAFEAIQQMNLKLTEVMAENERLKQRLEAAETAQQTRKQIKRQNKWVLFALFIMMKSAPVNRLDAIAMLDANRFWGKDQTSRALFVGNALDYIG